MSEKCFLKKKKKKKVAEGNIKMKIDNLVVTPRLNFFAFFPFAIRKYRQCILPMRHNREELKDTYVCMN